MKPLLHIILLLGISIASLPAQQTSWQWVSPLPQGNILNGIWTVDQDTIFAVGDYGTVIKSTNKGLTWQVTPNVTGIVEPLFAVQFISGSTGWIVGEYGRILKTTDGGATWYLQEADIMGDLYALSFISSTTGWTVGSQGKIYKTTNGGTTWTSQTSGTTSALYGVQFLSPAVGWIAGTNGTILGTTNGGTTWSIKTTPTTLSLYGVQFTSSVVGYAAGAFGTILKTTNSGTTWVQQVSSTDFSLFTMNFTSSLVGWASGVYGIIIKTTNGGLTWFEQSSATYNDIYSVKFANSSYGWAVGDFGTIVGTSDGGMTWIQQSTGTATELYGISFPSPTYGIAVGDEGLVVRSVDGGKSWVQQSSGTLQPLYGVHMITNLIGWAVGDSAVILKTTNGGQSWSSQNSRNDITLYSVFFLNTTTGWTVGDFGTILGTVNGGITWKAETTNTYSTPLKIKFINASVGWSVGYGGLVLKTTNGGTSWFEQVSNTFQTLYSLDIIDANHVIACGDFGTIVTTTDGGETWVDNSTEFYESFYGIAFSTLNNGWCVGDDGVIANTTDGGTTWNLLNSGTLNTLWDLQLLRSGTGGTLYAAGIGGTILVAGVTPLPVRTWTGISDSNWTSPGNWNPYGAPQNGDSVYIPSTAINPVLRTIQQQINISALHIGTGSRLTLAEGLSQFVISGSIKIEGTFEVRPTATTEIISGGTFSIGPFGQFHAGRSSLTINTIGYLKGNYYNLYLLAGAVSQSVGNIEIKNNLTTLSNLTLRQVDTLTILNPNPQGLQGSGIIGGGTIKRPISGTLSYEYRFESPATYLQFYPTGTLPDTVLMTSYPNTLGPGLSDSVFVRRYYNINAKGGSNYLALLSLRYDTSETRISIDNLALFRDSSGIIKNVGVSDFIDSDMVSISLDSVSRFSRWYLGYYDFYPKHPLEFIDSLIITDAGMVTDTIVFGTYPGATNGIDTLFGEYELPSIPPSGTFDIRWSITGTNGTNIDIRNVHNPANLEIMYTCLIQPSSAGYPVTLRWNKNVFPIGTVLLQDQATGGSIFSIDMKNQNSYTITNSGIRVVQISYKAPRYFSFPAGWNMASIPVTPTGDRRKISVFPNAITGAFAYDGFYYEVDSLTNGVGFWLKFAYPDTAGIEGLPLSADTLPVKDGWNMIGSISEPVGINHIVSVPASLTSSDYYYYENGYVSRDTILPARAYWIKAKSSGSLILSTDDGMETETFSASKLPVEEFNSLNITDAGGGNKILYFTEKADIPDELLDRYELPPQPPSGAFDARFTSGRYVEELPKSSGSLIVKVQSESYPVTIQWKIVQSSESGLRITDIKNNQLEQSPSSPGEGWVKVLNPEVKMLRIEIVPAQTVPNDFVLMQNYPNPFNPSTLVEFGLPAASTVTLKIYNILGEEITTVIDNEMLAAGIHKRSIDMQTSAYTGQLSSGIYFYRLNAKSSSRSFSDIKKMVLIK